MNFKQVSVIESLVLNFPGQLDSQYRQMASTENGSMAGFLYLPNFHTVLNVLKDLFNMCYRICIIFCGKSNSHSSDREFRHSIQANKFERTALWFCRIPCSPASICLVYSKRIHRILFKIFKSLCRSFPLSGGNRWTMISENSWKIFKSMIYRTKSTEKLSSENYFMIDCTKFSIKIQWILISTPNWYHEILPGQVKNDTEIIDAWERFVFLF